MDVNYIKQDILNANTSMGIEFGSTRIKAILVNSENQPIASGSHEWENRYEQGVWTYTLEDIWTGLQNTYADLAANVQTRYGVELRRIGALGVSAMMHGYLPFDKEAKLLVPFRTWRNTITEEAADKLSDEFNYNIPQRWSIAHLYQAVLNGEPHVKEINYLTTLAGYIHWQLTGEKKLGIGDASGMFPIDCNKKDYDQIMIDKLDELVAEKHFSWKLREILPEVIVAGENAGMLTEAGAKKLDITGKLEAGIPVCPAEGDAGTGMVATNSVRQNTGNISAGTSVFLMAVLEKRMGMPLSAYDAYVNIAGGIRLNEPAADLGIVMAIASSYKNRPIDEDTIVFGEVGLSGEVRAVTMPEQRVSEAKKLGFKRCIVPAVSMKTIGKMEGIEILGVENVNQAMNLV